MLSPDQATQLGLIAEVGNDQSLDKEVVRALDIQFFDTSFMTGYKNTQKTVGDYIDQTQKLRDTLMEPEATLCIAPKFNLSTYSLAAWYEPLDEWPQDQVDTMWSHELIIEYGLTAAPWHSDLLFEETEIDDYQGWPVRENETAVKSKVDKRRRKNPIKQASGIPIVKGTDGSIYELSFTGMQLTLEQAQACLVIDLSLPIDYQLNQAKHFLETHQEALIKSGFVERIPKQADRFGAFEEYLEILDLLDDGFSHLDIATKLDGLVPRTVSWKHDPVSNQSHPVKRMTSPGKPRVSVNQLPD